MIIIWGFRTRPSKLSEGQFFCPRDGGNRPYVHSRYRRWFTLFFIPLFPTGKGGSEVVRCQACGTSYKPDVLAGPRAAQPAAQVPTTPIQYPAPPLQYPAPPATDVPATGVPAAAQPWASAPNHGWPDHLK